MNKINEDTITMEYYNRYPYWFDRFHTLAEGEEVLNRLKEDKE